jgi:hypothetical protein
MEEKKSIPARGVLIALAVLLFVFALFILIAFLGVSVELLRGAYPDPLAIQAALSLVFSALETAIFIFFGVRILTGLSHKGKARKETLIFGLTLSAFYLLNQLVFLVVDEVIAARNPKVSITFDALAITAYFILNSALFVLFLLALVFHSKKTKTSLILALVAAGLYAFRALAGLVVDLSASAPQTTAILLDFLPLSLGTLLIIAYALNLSAEKRERVSNPTPSPIAVTAPSAAAKAAPESK